MDWITRLLNHLDNGSLSAFGGLVSYLYQMFKQAHAWNFKKVILHVAIAFGAGVLFGSFVPSTVWARDGWLILTGYLSFAMLDMVDSHKERIISFISKVIKD